MKVIRVNTDASFEVLEIENTLDEIRNAIGAEYIDVVRMTSVNFGGFDVIVDDEGLLRERTYNKLISYSFRVGDLVGNVIITRSKNGETIGLTDAEIKGVSHVLTECRKLLHLPK